MAARRLLLACALAAALAPLQAAEPGAGFAPVDPPQAAPGLALADSAGVAHRLAEQRGKVVLVNFWATWCPPCREEMPALERLRQAFDPQRFVVLAVDVGEDARTVAAFARRVEPRPAFALLLDRDAAVARAWGVRGMPTSFLIDRQGRIAYHARGPVRFDAAEVTARVRELTLRP